jgi:hypothetical protein
VHTTVDIHMQNKSAVILLRLFQLVHSPPRDQTLEPPFSVLSLTEPNKSCLKGDYDDALNIYYMCIMCTC